MLWINDLLHCFNLLICILSLRISCFLFENYGKFFCMLSRLGVRPLPKSSLFRGISVVQFIGCQKLSPCWWGFYFHLVIPSTLPLCLVKQSPLFFPSLIFLLRLKLTFFEFCIVELLITVFCHLIKFNFQFFDFSLISSL